MSLLKKNVVNSRPSASRNQSRDSFRPAGQASRTNTLEIKPDGRWAGKLTFVEDYTLEHSLPGRHITSIEISGSF
jgi:hypothetical protein